MGAKPEPRLTHNVYVIELHPQVLRFAPFRARNRHYQAGKPCVFMAVTGLAPELRFANHLNGVKADHLVARFGLRLLPDLYEYANPMPLEAAREMEIEIANELREEGYGVWQA